MENMTDLEPYGSTFWMEQPHGDLTCRHVSLTLDERIAAADGWVVMRGNGRFCDESWITDKNQPDTWNKWILVRPEAGYTLEDYNNCGGRPRKYLQTHTIWWYGAYRGLGFSFPKDDWVMYRVFYT